MSTVIELTILDTDREGLGLIQVVDPVQPAEARIHVALRLVPSLFTALNAEAKKHRVSVNAFVAWAIARLLRT